MKALVGTLVVVLMVALPAYADTLAEWTFEVSIPTTAGPHAAEIGSGSALGYHTLSGVVYSNPVGNGSLESFSSNYWSIGDYYQFQTSSIGFENITITWDQTRSSTGPATFDLEWSTDGTTFTTLTNDYTVNAVTWSSTTPVTTSTFGPTAGPAALDNQPTIYFRLTSQVTTATAGTNRVDNVRIEGIPEPASLALLAIGAVAAMRRRR